MIWLLRCGAQQRPTRPARALGCVRMASMQIRRPCGVGCVRLVSVLTARFSSFRCCCCSCRPRQVRYLTFFRYFFLNNVFIIALLCIFALTILMLSVCPKNQADEVEKTLDRIAKNSNTKTGLKDALEEDDD